MTSSPPSAFGATSLAYRQLIERHRQANPVTVTQPQMPPLQDYTKMLEGIWERRWLTNDGVVHRELEKKLCEYLGVEHLSLFCNGTVALLVALQALRINGGSVITTPFTFPATTHVLHWNQVSPIFCDVDPINYNIDPEQIERLITSDTRAILAVHVYGNPCKLEDLQSLADRHGLHLIYDAAHAFGVKVGTKSILEFGDMSMLSFHATKVFSTVEGGALVSKSATQRERITSLKNFGIADEETVIGPGINGKMNEFQAAFGLLQLRTIDENIEKRRLVAEQYRKELAGVRGIKFMTDTPGVRQNFSYFPVTVDEREYGISRNQLYGCLREANILSRKYFYPLVSRAPCYSAIPSATASNLPVAERAARDVLCLPIFSALPSVTVTTVCDLIKALPAALA